MQCPYRALAKLATFFSTYDYEKGGHRRVYAGKAFWSRNGTHHWVPKYISIDVSQIYAEIPPVPVLHIRRTKLGGWTRSTMDPTQEVGKGGKKKAYSSLRRLLLKGRSIIISPWHRSSLMKWIANVRGPVSGAISLRARSTQDAVNDPPTASFYYGFSLQSRIRIPLLLKKKKN